jgi:hypothetical protein
VQTGGSIVVSRLTAGASRAIGGFGGVVFWKPSSGSSLLLSNVSGVGTATVGGGMFTSATVDIGVTLRTVNVSFARSTATYGPQTATLAHRIRALGNAPAYAVLPVNASAGFSFGRRFPTGLDITDRVLRFELVDAYNQTPVTDNSTLCSVEVTRVGGAAVSLQYPNVFRASLGVVVATPFRLDLPAGENVTLTVRCSPALHLQPIRGVVALTTMKTQFVTPPPLSWLPSSAAARISIVPAPAFRVTDDDDSPRQIKGIVCEVNSTTPRAVIPPAAPWNVRSASCRCFTAWLLSLLSCVIVLCHLHTHLGCCLTSVVAACLRGTLATTPLVSFDWTPSPSMAPSAPASRCVSCVAERSAR